MTELEAQILETLKVRKALIETQGVVLGYQLRDIETEIARLEALKEQS